MCHFIDDFFVLVSIFWSARPGRVRMRICGWLIGIICVLVWQCPALAWQGKVVRVLDGDSILVKRGGRLYEIRLYGIDAPEYKQPFGRQARRVTSRLVYKKIVDIQPMDVDRYHRTVALVSVGGRLVNRELVHRGAAWLYPRYCKKQPLCRQLDTEEQQARSQHLGLWAGPNPLSPSQWKRRNKKSAGRSRPHFRHHRQH